MITAQASMATIGYNAPEVERALGRAETICREIGNATEMFPILGALRIYYLGFGNRDRGHELAPQMVEIAENQGSKPQLAEAYFHMGDNLMLEGQFPDSLSYLERSMAHCQPGQKVAADIDALTMALQRSIQSLWCLGYADKALETSIRAFEHAASLKHPASMAVAYLGFAIMRMLRRDDEAEQEAEALAKFAEEHGFSSYNGPASHFRSVAVLERGSVDEALAGLLLQLDYTRTSGYKLALPRGLGSVAEAYCRMGDPNRGLSAISEAFAEMEGTSERLYESELHRIKGELLFMQDASNAEHAQQSFRNAIEVARRQQARFFELRATMSLARLFDRQATATRRARS